MLRPWICSASPTSRTACPFMATPRRLLIDYARGAAPLPEGRYAVAEIGQGEIIAEVSLAALPGGPRHIWAKAVALHDEAGQVTGAIEAIRDVTKRHCAEEALRESEEKFRRIVETANEGVWCVRRRLQDNLRQPPHGRHARLRPGRNAGKGPGRVRARRPETGRRPSAGTPTPGIQRYLRSDATCARTARCSGSWSRPARSTTPRDTISARSACSRTSPPAKPWKRNSGSSGNASRPRWRSAPGTCVSRPWNWPRPTSA